MAGLAKASTGAASTHSTVGREQSYQRERNTARERTGSHTLSPQSHTGCGLN
jgi:hypothetical protein